MADNGRRDERWIAGDAEKCDGVSERHHLLPGLLVDLGPAEEDGRLGVNDQSRWPCTGLKRTLKQGKSEKRRALRCRHVYDAKARDPRNKRGDQPVFEEAVAQAEYLGRRCF